MSSQADFQDEDNNYKYGLDSFDVVIFKEDFTYGGNQFTIMFQDKPDTFFVV